jgi:hypothetical protein
MNHNIYAGGWADDLVQAINLAGVAGLKACLLADIAAGCA